MVDPSPLGFVTLIGWGLFRGGTHRSKRIITFNMHMKQSGETLEVQNKCAEIKISAERKAGESIKEGQEKGEIYTKEMGRPQKVSNDTILNSSDAPIRLPELGITHDESSRWQTIADMPEKYIVEVYSSSSIDFKCFLNSGESSCPCAVTA